MIIFPPLYPTYPEKIIKWNTKLSTAHAMQNQMTGFFLPRIPNQKATYNRLNTHTTSGPGCGRHVAAVCIWTNMHQTGLFHTGQQWLKKHWWGFLHTHLPMFWGQSSVEHHCGYFYMHTIIQLHLTWQLQEMQQLHCYYLLFYFIQYHINYCTSYI